MMQVRVLIVSINSRKGFPILVLHLTPRQDVDRRVLILMFHFHEPIIQVQIYQAEDVQDINRSGVSGESSREPNRCRRISRFIRVFSSASCDELLRDKCMPASCWGALISTLHQYVVSETSSQYGKIESSHTRIAPNCSTACCILPSLAGVDSMHKDLAEESKEPPLSLQEVLSGLTQYSENLTDSNVL